MIVNVAYKPMWLAPIYNPIMWSVLSTNVNNLDFKYVFDIYVNDIKINTIKQRANPNGYGMIDVSSILEGYMGWNDTAAPVTQGETSIDWSNGKVFSDNNLLSKHVYLKVGEEWTSNTGVIINYNGIADVSGDPAYILNSNTTGIALRAWSASMTDHQQQWSMQNTTSSGIFGGDPFNGGKIYDHGLGLAYPLSHNVLNQSMYSFDKEIISFLNWSPTPSNPDQRPIYGFRYTFTDASGSLLGQYDIPMISTKGFAQRSICSDQITTELDPKYDIVHVLASPSDVLKAVDPSATWSLTPGTILKIQGYSRGTGCTFGSPVTQPWQTTILEYCAPLYERVRLSWLNTFGSRDYMNFTMLSEKTIETKSDSYTQQQMNWAAASPVPQLNNSNIIGNLGIKGGQKVYNKTATTTYKIQTDWLTQDQVNLLESLQNSPQVMAYIHDPNNSLSDYYPYSCVLTNPNVTIKNVKQVKLYQATADLTVSMVQSMQNV